MTHKPKFNPVVTRVKLNPEQAVLACACYESGFTASRAARGSSGRVCTLNRPKRTIISWSATATSTAHS
jgi:uncharacterized FlgJ-related protein